MNRPLSLVVGLSAFGTLPSPAVILLSENFDGGSVNSVFAYTTTSGVAPATNGPGSNSANSAMLTSLTASNNNSLAWNPAFIPATPQTRLTFDFRLSDDAANAGAGGCCGEAADGLGIGFFPVAAFGPAGGVNPAAGPANFDWERPGNGNGAGAALTGFQSFILGIDIFNGGGTENHFNLSWNGSQIANVAPTFTLNNNVWHRAVLTTTDLLNGSSQVNLDVIQDVNGAAIVENVFNVNAPGLNTAGAAIGNQYRLIAGGRTGGAFVEGRLDNVLYEAIPEPGSLALLGLAGALAFRRRRK
jgi:hypothetical protein